MTDQTLHCREAFEKFAASRGADVRRFLSEPTRYYWQSVQIDWEYWLEAWNTRSDAKASAPEGEAVSVRYFAANPAECEFDTFDTVEQAKAKAEQLLEWAGDAAYEDGWADEPPQICYGIVLAGCEEEPGSRKPAPEGSDFTELVSFRLTESTYTRSNAKAGEVDATYPYESALSSLIEAVSPELDTGNVLSDAEVAIAAAVQQANEAERYRWIKAEDCSGDEIRYRLLVLESTPPDQLDEAIDKALSNQRGDASEMGVTK